jgi:hypothetical protein
LRFNIQQCLEKLVLGSVLSVVSTNHNNPHLHFVPYRESKLTNLLKGSLEQSTLFVACVSSYANDAEETLDCLQYVMRLTPSKSSANPQSVVVCEHNMLKSPGSGKMNVNSPSSGTIAMQELKEQVQILAAVLLTSIETGRASSFAKFSTEN